MRSIGGLRKTEVLGENPVLSTTSSTTDLTWFDPGPKPELAVKGRRLTKCLIL
jgi:hypothetical protein